MPESHYKDKRAFTRFSITILLSYSGLNSQAAKQAETQDISARGIGLIADEELAPHTPLEMWLKMPDNDEQIHIKGDVVWSRMIGPDRYRVGVYIKETPLKPIPIILRILQSTL